MTLRAPDAIRAEMVDLATRTKACQIELAAALGKPKVNRAIIWKGARLDALKRDYERTSDPLRYVGRRHGTSAGCVVRLAKQHGWVRGGAA